ncbi:GNAT family N-acetyltransferase [Streptomyces sp. NPDC012600]|uniref:GNAT family N-acetyltransferase n=1 Tax=Streptomyces sp. NPDC012600 TaxID=3415005 RepID=UPI003C2CE547
MAEGNGQQPDRRRHLQGVQHDRMRSSTVIATFDGWRCSTYQLAVHPDHRRQGIATALREAAEQRFTALGGRRVDAMVLGANERAHHT